MPLRFTLRQLEYFVAVGEAGSIVQAANEVNVSSPSISSAVAQMEREFGLQLFVRKHAHGLSLTRAGQMFLVQSKKVLSEARALNQLANDITGNVRGPLAVGCLLTFAQLMAPYLRREFENQFPDVQVTQIEEHQSKLFELLRHAKIDIALTYDLEIPSDLVFLPLAELPPYALLPESHPLAGHLKVTVDDLRDFPMVLLDLPFSSDYFLSLFAACGFKPVVAERTRDMAVMRSLVANEFGYSIANFRPLTDAAPDGRKLCFIPLQSDVQPLQIGLVTSERAENVLTVKAFVEHCRKHISDEKIPGVNLEGLR